MYSRFGYLSLIHILIGEHCGKVENGDFGILGVDKKSLSRLPLLDLSTKLYNDPDAFANHCIKNQFLATKGLDQEDLTLVKAVATRRNLNRECSRARAVAATAFQNP